tara:strand:- start:15146 stop:17350 length:2205 start_codon:yes stop_codon:yes gene_type:complete
MANIVIMPGGFHPFHAGHAALYNSIKEKYGEGSDIYVAASNNQKERPFPFEIKEKLAQLSGVQPGEFVQVKSPFVPKEITDKYDPDKDTIVFVRSEKDKDEFPKPGSVKKDGSPGYFQHIDTAQRGAQPFSKVGYMDYLPVKEFAGITSATQIRDTWPSLNDEQREEFITHIYPRLKGNDKLIKNVVKLLSKGMSLNEGLAYIDDKGNRVNYTRPDLPTNIEDLVIDWFNDRDRYTKATLKQKGYIVDVDDKFNNIDITDKKGRKYTVSVDDAMGKLIQQAYQEPINEDKPVARYNTKQANKMIRRYCRKRGIPIQKILTQKVSGRRKQHGGHLDPKRNLTVMTTPEFDQGEFNQETQHYEKPAFTQNDANEIQVMLNAPKVTITSGGSYLNVHGLMQGELNDPPLREAFVSPDQSKQYWNHDAQKIGVGGQIEFPLTDTPNLNGRRQGFNEGEERNEIAGAAYEWLLNLATSRPDLDYDELYRALEGVSHNDLGTQEIDYFIGEPLGLNMDNKGSIVNAVLGQMTQTEGRYRYNESIDKIRGMIKETTDEQKSKSVDLHRKLFELMEEEKKNVVKLRGFGREADKPIPDINKVRAEKEREQERENNRYSEQRQKQDKYLTAIQEILFGLHEEFADMEQLGLMPIELKDAFNNTTQLIDFISDYKDSEDQNNFPFTEDLIEKLQIKAVELREYFGGWRDTSAPRVLRKQTPKLDINSFWNTTDLSETADYIEEK